MPKTFPQTLLVFLFSALIFGVIARKLKQPILLGYLFAGLAVSLLSKTIGLDENSLKFLSDLGLTLLMFSVGLGFSLKKKEGFKKLVVGGAVVQILATTLIGTLLSFFLFKFSLASSIIISLAFSLSSTAIIVKILHEQGRADSLSGEIMTGWLLIQDLAVLPMVAILPMLFNQGIVLKDLFFLGKALAVVAVSWFLVKEIVPKLSDRVSSYKNRELLLLFTICLIFVFSIFTKFLGFSYGLGAFLAGLVLNQATSHFAIFSEIRPMKDIFLAVFFVSLGLTLDLSFLLPNLSRAMLVGGSFLILKILIIGIILIFFKYHAKIIFNCSFGLSGVGEFAFVLASTAYAGGFLKTPEYSMVILITLITMVLTPGLMSLGDKAYLELNKWSLTRPKIRRKFFAGFDNQPELEELPFSDHVVILGFGRVGGFVGLGLQKAKIPYLVVEYNHHLVRELKLKGIPVIFGDPSNLDVLDFAQIDKAKLVIIAIPDSFTQREVVDNCRMLNPRIKIICRSHSEEDRGLLKKMGVDQIIQPEFEASLSITHRAMQYFKFEKEEINKNIKEIRDEHL